MLKNSVIKQKNTQTQ